MAAFSPTIMEVISQVTWARSYKWRIQFGGDGFNGEPLPAPFDKIFPAIDVDEGLSLIQDRVFDMGVASFSVPQSSQSRDLGITFYDNEEATLHTWIMKWVNSISSDEQHFVRTVTKSVRQVLVQQLSGEDKVVKERKWYVYPFGPLVYHGDNDANPLIYTVGFKIAGRVGANNVG